MSEPTVEKTYQYGTGGSPTAHINFAIPLSDGDPVFWQKVWLQIHDALLGVSSGAWTVVGSCNSSSYAMDGTDYWVGTSSIVIATDGTPHSWLVLEQAGLGGGSFQFCINCTGSYRNRVELVVSPGGNFTGGSLTARPTASDEVILWTSVGTNFLRSSSSSSPPGNVVLHCIVSTDGAVTRIYYCYNGNVNAVITLEAVKNPESGWSNAWFAIVRGGTVSECLSYASICDLRSYITGVIGGDEVNFNLNTILYGTNPMGQQITGQNDDLSLWEDYPIWLGRPECPHRGIKGEVYDAWFATDDATIASGDRTPSGSPYTHALLGDLLIPWADAVCTVT